MDGVPTELRTEHMPNRILVLYRYANPLGVFTTVGGLHKIRFSLQLGKHVPAETNTHATTELLLETLFYTRSVKSGYKEDR
jgi:hypothetical protein